MSGNEQSKENQGNPNTTAKDKSKENQDQQSKETPNKPKKNQEKQKIAAMEQKIKQLEEELKKKRKRKAESPADKTLDEYITQLNKMFQSRETVFKDSVLKDFQQYQKSVQAELERMNKLLSKSNGHSNFTRTKQWVESQSFTSAF